MTFPPQQSNIGRLLAALTHALQSHHLPFMLIGGQATLVHGQPRLTDDIDITLGVDPSALNAVRAVCDTVGLVPIPQNLETFVRDTFVLPARDAASGIRVDLIFSTTDYERQAIARAESVMMNGVSVPFATAEDLIIHKLFAGRPRDIEDVRGVVSRKRETLDWDYLTLWARAFSDIPDRETMPVQIQQLRDSKM